MKRATTLRPAYVPRSTPLKVGIVDVGSDVRVGLHRTPAGPVDLLNPDRHLLVVHAGRPVNGISRAGGLAQRRVHLHGDIDVVPARCPAGWEDDEEAIVLTLSLPHTFIRAVAMDLDLDPDRATMTPQLYARDARIEHVAWALKAELEAGELEESLYAKQLVQALGVHLLRRERDLPQLARASRQALAPHQLKRVADYIERDLASELSLAELAAVAGMSVSHFTLRFKQATGLSVHRYVMQRRVERAQALLAAGDHSISRIALDTGFAHQSHLARWMRRLLGVAPTSVAGARSDRRPRYAAADTLSDLSSPLAADGLRP